jgi:thymidylate synthase
MTAITEGRTVRNFRADLDMNDSVVATELFPLEALDVYSDWHLELPVNDADRARYFNSHRGGGQGDSRAGMRDKLANVVEGLTLFPASKRAVISVVADPAAHHTDTDNAKCMREVHFHLDGDHLDGTVLFRSQAAEIFPKNIHFLGRLFAEIAAQLPGDVQPGSLHYLASVLVSDRS